MHAILRVCFFFFLGAASLIQAQTITGTVHNETTGKASVGDEVVLIRLGEGMEEEAHTKTGAEGAFTLNVVAPNADHFVRVIHQRVNYDQTVNGTAPLQIIVYNAVARVPGLRGNIGIAQMESDGKSLKVTEMYVVTNSSNPPVTQSRPDNFEISVPQNAVFELIEVRGPRGIWTKIAPATLQGRTGKYNVNFPLRPGDTLFKFAYRLPYTGHAIVRLKLPYPITNFGVMHPPSIAFKALRPDTFQSPGIVEGLQVEHAIKSPLQGDVPAFEISGMGTAPEHGTQAATAAKPSAPPANTNNPAAAHATNIDARGDQSKRELWLLTGGIILILAVFGLAAWRARRKVVPIIAGKSVGGQPSILEALKEELFQLESDRLHGSISAEEYAATKDALNQSIQRALARQKQ